MTTTLGARGQVVIPVAIRSQKDLRAGDDFAVTVEGNRIVLEKLQRRVEQRRRPRIILKKGKLPLVVTPKNAQPLTLEEIIEKEGEILL